MRALPSCAWLGVAIALGACNAAMQPPNQTDPADARVPGKGDMPSTDAAALSGVFVARKAESGLIGMKARFHGRFGVRDGCLIFEGGDVVYLPVLSPLTPVRVFADRVEIGGRTHGFDRDTVIVGGAAAPSGGDLLEPGRPASCDYPLLRAAGVQ